MQAHQQGADAVTEAIEARTRGELESLRAELAQSREGYRLAIVEKERLGASVRRLEAKLRTVGEQLLVQWGDHLAVE